MKIFKFMFAIIFSLSTFLVSYKVYAETTNPPIPTPENSAAVTAQPGSSLGTPAATATSGTNVSGGDAGGGDLSLPGGINISKPSALSRFTSFDNAYTSIFNIVVQVSGAVFIIFLLYGGIMYLTSMGNEEQATKARKILIDSVIGIGIVALSWIAGTWIIEQLQNAGLLKDL